jgi:hypothetical protein
MTWYKNLPFELVIPIEMPKRAMSGWRDAIEVLADSMKTFDVKVTVVRLHYHVPPRQRFGEKHPMGETVSEDGEITLCSNDVDTVVHELAHVKSNENHTPKWARAYFKFADYYMDEEYVRDAMKHASQFYPSVRKIARERGIIG